jgi:3-methyl-2-oxobutanoate hydroxymethyltransferase
MKKHTTRSLRLNKSSTSDKKLNMLTCYDYQTACLLDETALDLILVGDSLGNVILGYETTIEVTLEEMRIFSSAVKRGAQNKFVIADMPFGSYASYDQGIENGIYLFQNSKCEAVKLEGASELNCKIIKRLTESGVPVMGHIGLMPQSVHAQGGYYKHGKTDDDKKRILKEALALEQAGCFSIVLECVEETLANEITKAISIPTIGIGSGVHCDGQVLVLNDLLGMSTRTPSFVEPIANLYEVKKDLISEYLN